MRKVLLILFVISTSVQAGYGTIVQDTSKLVISPAIHFVAPWRLGLSGNVQYNFNKRYCADVYISLANDFISKPEKYLKRTYNYRSSVKAGLGVSFHWRGFTNTFSCLAGIKTDALKESIHNPQFPAYTYSDSYTRADIGIMHKLIFGKKKYRFFIAEYFPVFPDEIKYDYKTFMHIDIGVRIHLSY